MSICFYAISVVGLQGPDFVQLGTAAITVLSIVLIPFQYLPVKYYLPFDSIWTPIIMSMITRAIGIVITVFVSLIAVFSAFVEDCLRRRRKQEKYELMDDSTVNK